MKPGIQALAIAGLTLLTSCGTSSSDKEKPADTTIATTTTVDQTTVSNPSTRKVEIPPTTRTSFVAKYPQASNIQWEYYRPDMSYVDWEWSGWHRMDTSDYVAHFKLDTTDYWAWYDEEGNWIGTTTTITDNNLLPSAVNNAIKNMYNGYTVVSVKKENDKNRTAYEIQLENGTQKMKLLIDENGKVIKKKMISGDIKTKEKMNPKDSAM